jgi:hypothetical protein
MDKLIERLNELLKIRSLVTLILLLLVFILSVTDRVSADVIMSIFGTVIGFYFGTKNKDNDNTKIE